MAARRILLIDDEPGICRIVQISLTAIAHWEVLLAHSGLVGLAIAEAEQPDAILLDVMMPGMDGVTTLQHLQANPTTQTIPVIFLTAKVQSNDRQQFSELAIAGVITKPFKAPDLVQQMRSLLNWQDDH